MFCWSMLILGALHFDRQIVSSEWCLGQGVQMARDCQTLGALDAHQGVFSALGCK